MTKKAHQNKDVSRAVVVYRFCVRHYVAILVGWAFFLYVYTNESEKVFRFLTPFGTNESNTAACEIEPVNCIINHETTIECQLRPSDNETYLPFTFLSKYYEAYGTHEHYKSGKKLFRYEHSYGNVLVPKENYTALGMHADDVYYFVEGRGKVLYISGTQGIPVCISEWDKDGYFYPVNVGQYGLAHYSRSFIVKKTRVVNKVDEAGSSKDKWKLSGAGVAGFGFGAFGLGAASEYVNVKYDSGVETNVLDFSTSDSLDKPGMVIDVPLSQGKIYEIITYNKFPGRGSISLFVETAWNKTYTIHYVIGDEVADNQRPFMEGNQIFYKVGPRAEWNRLTRDLDLDLHKAILLHSTTELNLISMKINQTDKILKGVYQITLRGTGSISNLYLSDSAHMEHFMDTAEWMQRNIDENGGWKINSTRYMGIAKLTPGWYSALSQGCGISLMVRAYGYTKERRFLDAAIKALKTFHTLSADGGVKSVFFDKYIWFEEYPTSPSSFVLNGFITSLIGLYDLAKIAPSPDNLDAGNLYVEGMKSLKTLLPLYDTGSRSIYDLKHFTMPGTPPNVARWDYHNLHVMLLMHIYSIDHDPLFRRMYERWDGYRKGKVVATN